MVIKILGPGCPKCRQLYDNTRKAVQDMHVDAEVTKVEDIQEIMKYGVLMTPGLVIDEKVVSSGKVLSPGDIGKKINQK